MHDWIEQLPTGTQRSYPASSMIARPGEPDNRVFILVTGRARISLLGGAKEQTLGYLEQGGLFVTHTPTWVEAIEPTTVLSWPMADLRGLISRQPDVAMIALREIGQIMSAALELIEDLAFRSVEGRLARFLIRESSGRKDGTILLVESTERLATRLGTSRQTLSTLINRMQRERLIEKAGRQCMRIIDPDRLIDMTDDVSGR
ncbi:MAG: Crp/Fnr family transcriptional regulator [Oceanospirillaceae bacterium]|nr:Crp/Fnr family transcriptional regulator [Oceanospirillaceae bacterium]